MSTNDVHQMPPKDRKVVDSLEGNASCIDCGAGNPEWASVSLGTVFCLNCSGQHRGLGTHISFVRSIAMDSWTEKQLQTMKMGGNFRCKEFLKKHGLSFDTASIKEKYDSPQAELYRRVLKARVEGTPEPTELPKPNQPANSKDGKNVPVEKRKMQGFGSGPDPRQELKKQRRKNIALATGSIIAVAAGVLLNRK